MSTRKTLPHYPSITTERRQEGAVTFLVASVPCSDPSCDCRLERRCKGKPMPQEAFVSAARTAGWTAQPNKGRFYCPAHS